MKPARLEVSKMLTIDPRRDDQRIQHISQEIFFTRIWEKFNVIRSAEIFGGHTLISIFSGCQHHRNGIITKTAMIVHTTYAGQLNLTFSKHSCLLLILSKHKKLDNNQRHHQHQQGPQTARRRNPCDNIEKAFR